ncbi:MAG: hypothetical protein AB1348_08985 [Nitrospirota bacterium]
MKIVAVRVPEEIKKKMKEIPEDWSDYLRKAIEDRIEREKNKKILRDLKQLWKGIPKTPKGFSVKSIREDRNSG